MLTLLSIPFSTNISIYWAMSLEGLFLTGASKHRWVGYTGKENRPREIGMQ